MTTSPLLQARGLRVSFPGKRSGLRRGPATVAVDGIDLEIGRGEVVGLVGESGSGKSTVARALLRLVARDDGELLLDGEPIGDLSNREFRDHRRRMQMVFQDPYSSLDPSATVLDIVSEPLRTHTNLSRADRVERVGGLLEKVGLSASHLDRYPYEFSGGQRQRIAIARAIAVEPDLLICDEAVTALDVSTQTRVLELLADLIRDLDMACLFISHDLAVVRGVVDRVAVMYLGRIVEQGPVDRVYTSPAHPYTRALLSSIPIPDPDRARAARRARPAEAANEERVEEGCPFAPRCPEVMDVCRTTEPSLRPVHEGGLASCHLVETSKVPTAEVSS